MTAIEPREPLSRGEEPATTRAPPRRAWLAPLAVAAGLIALLLVWIWIRGAEDRAVREMAPADRAALYRRTIDDLRAVCGVRRAEHLAGHCEDQARFALKFPECDEACARLAGDVLERR